MLTDLTINGEQAKAILPAGCLLSADLTYSQKQITNLLLTVVDHKDYAATKALYANLNEDTDCVLGDLTLRPHRFTTGDTGDAPTLTISLKVKAIAALEKRTGGKSWGNTNVTQWAKAEIRAVGGDPLVQEGLGEREIERKEPEGDHEKPESSHDVLASTAKKVGAWYYDTGEQVVLARPSWLVSRPGMPKYDLSWDDWGNHSPALLTPPNYQVDFNARPWEGRETLTLTLSDNADDGPAHKARPGNIVHYTGKAAPADPLWIITEVRVPDHWDQPVTITCWRPVDPPEIVDDSTESGEGGTAGVPTGPIGQGGWAGEQLKNAAEIVREGQSRNLPALAYELAVACAMGESSLRNIKYGDAAGPDSLGLFQQRAAGWGSASDRMTPSKAAGFFYGALVKTDYKGSYANGAASVVFGGFYGPGNSESSASVTIHNVQRNSDPTHYRRFWQDAREVVKACIAAGKSSGSKATGELGKRIDDIMSGMEGKFVDEDNGFPPGNPFQCVDVAARMLRELFGIPMPKANGVDYWRHPDLSGKYVAISANQAPRKGDIVSWSGSSGAYPNGSYGHVAIYSHSERGQHFFLSANPGPARVQPLSSSGILGWMRPVRSE